MIGEETSADVEPLRIKLGVDSMPDIRRKCLRGPHKNRKKRTAYGGKVEQVIFSPYGISNENYDVLILR